MAANSTDNGKKKSRAPLKAAALRYDNRADNAPKIVAKGQKHVAEKILEIAKTYDIPIHQDADLVNILEGMELDQEIPMEVYAVVAEVFAYIYRVNQNKAGQQTK